MMYISVLWVNLYRTKTHNKYTSDNLEVKGNYQEILWDYASTINNADPRPQPSGRRASRTELY